MAIPDFPKLTLPATPVLVHVCCATCCGDILQSFLANRITITIYFHNPNIDTLHEYEKRKQDIIRFAQKHSLPFIDADYNHNAWLNMVSGMERAPERGKRCEACYTDRLKATAEYAACHNFPLFTSSLGISRYKPFEIITAIGKQLAEQHENLTYYDYNWRKKGGQERMFALAKSEDFYQQKYCGCEFSKK